MSAMNLVSITEQASREMFVLKSELKKKIHNYIYKDLSRRNRPMDEYKDTYRIKADFFCAVVHSVSIYFEREKNGSVIIARIIKKKIGIV